MAKHWDGFLSHWRLVVPGIGRVSRESERAGRKIKGCKVDEMSMVVTGG